jgi:phenylalanyl-tRNA synthetase alpha chain
MSADDDLIGEIARLEDEARVRLDAAATLDELRAAETDVLGKRSPLPSMKKRLGGLDTEDRRAVGKVLHGAQEALAALLVERRAVMEAAERAEQLIAERLDLTEVLPAPGVGHLHLVTQAIEHLEDVFVGLGFTVAEGPEVETDWNNFGALNFPPCAPTPPRSRCGS